MVKWNQFNVDWEDRIDYHRLRKERVEKLRKEMKKNNFDAMLVTKSETVRFITGMRHIHNYAFYVCRYLALLPLNGDPILGVPSGGYVSAKQRMSWIKDVRALPMAFDDRFVAKESANDILKPMFEAAGVTEGRVGIDILPLCVIESLKNALPKIELVDGYDALYWAKAIKTEDEINVLRIANEIAGAGVETAIELIKPGVRECEIVAEVAKKMYELGAEDFPYTPQIISGEHSAPYYMGIPTEKIIRYGDHIFMDIGAIFNGYNSDIARCYVLGRATEEQKKYYKAVYQTLQTATELSKDGALGSEVVKAARKVIIDAGLEKDMYFGMLVHGIGTMSQEIPVIGERVVAEKREVTLKEGMVLCYEPGIFKPGLGGFRIENSVAVRKDRGETLTHVRYAEDLLD